MKIHRFGLNEKGFTIVEAMIAIAVLVVGILGLQSAMRRGLVNSVKSWDRVVKTNIALSRMEEHKAQIFAKYQPGMVLPIVRPTLMPTPGIPTPGFSSGAITYTNITQVSIDAVNNAVSTAPGYGVTFLTPGREPTYYYGDANPNPTPTPNNAWRDFDTQSNPCTQTLGNISFAITTPKNVRGILTLSALDFKGLKRSEKFIVGAAVSNLAAGSIPPSTPNPIPFPITNLETHDGKINVTVQQTGSANNWGIMMESAASNSCAFTIISTPRAGSTSGSFPGTPVALDMALFGGSYGGTPPHATPGCDPNASVLSAAGTVASGAAPVSWRSDTNLPFELDAAGKVYATVHLMSTMSVSMIVVCNGGAYTVSKAVTATSTGWYEVVSAGLSDTAKITQLLFSFRGSSSASTNYLAVDSLRVVYDNALNPNAVLTSATLSVLDSYQDKLTYKDFVVSSSVDPITLTGSASGYQVEVVVHNSKNGVIKDTFPPVTITNSVSP